MQLRWLLPGMHVKRWLLLLAVSFAALGLGIAVVLQDLYQYHHFRWPWFVGFLALRWLPHYHSVKALIFFSLGVGGAAYAVYKLNTSLLSAVVADNAKLVDLVYRHRLGNRGPRVVAIGGGHGLSILLRGLKRRTDNLTAIVTVADDGGSSGKLRRELAILPPGDFRNCIAALSDAEPLMEELLQYRFPEGSGLEGHSFGNLYIAAMRGVTGNFEAALSESSRILNVRGQILPSTLADLTLHARLEDGSVVDGESSIKHHQAPLDYVFIRPKHAEAHPEAALYRHLGSGLIDVVLVNRTSAVAPRSDLVSPEAGPLPDPRIHVVHADVVDRANPRYHDPALLAQAVIELYRAKAPRVAAP